MNSPVARKKRRIFFFCHPIGLKTLKKVFAFHCRCPLSGYLLSTLKEKISDVSNKCLLDARARTRGTAGNWAEGAHIEHHGSEISDRALVNHHQRTNPLKERENIHHLAPSAHAHTHYSFEWLPLEEFHISNAEATDRDIANYKSFVRSFSILPLIDRRNIISIRRLNTGEKSTRRKRQNHLRYGDPWTQRV